MNKNFIGYFIFGCGFVVVLLSFISFCAEGLFQRIYNPLIVRRDTV